MKTKAFENTVLTVVSSKHLWVDSEGIKTTGGFGRQMEGLSRFFKKIVLVVPMKEEAIAKPGYRISIDSLEIVPLPNIKGSDRLAKLRLAIVSPVIAWRILRRYREFDLIQFRYPGYVGLIGLIIHNYLPVPRRPAFALVVGNWPERIRATRSTPLRRAAASILDRVSRKLLRSIPVFVQGKELLRSMSGISNNLFLTVSTTIDSTDIVAPNVGEEKVRRLLYVGRLASEKGLDVLVRGFAQCIQRGQDFKLRIVGDGPERSRLQDLAVQLSVSDRIEFMGYVPLGPDLNQLFCRSDVFVLPSLSEGTPKVIIEALAKGLIVVSTSVGGIPSLVTHEESALLVEAGSPDKLADALCRLVSEPALARRLAQSGALVAGRFTLENQLREMLNNLVGTGFP